MTSKKVPTKKEITRNSSTEDRRDFILKVLDNNKSKDIVSIDLHGKTDIADYMIVASGTSSRHVKSIADNLLSELRDNDLIDEKIAEGKQDCNWVLLDADDIVIHIFKPEVRGYYCLDEMWNNSNLALGEKS